ncbi:MAG: biotin/lipoyl-containing protein [Vulcanimicrobiaceae bacterium]|jgi:acetyl-CoA carboxylase biotin carboxyl carrier protein
MTESSKDIEALAAIAREFDLDAVRVRIGEREIEIVRRRPRPIAAAPAYPGAGATAPAAGGGPTASVHTKKVTAPLVGVFYRSAAPGEEPFVNVGDRVEVGDTVCTLEAMKIFNEITSDFAGTIARVVPENGELVALGDDLFWIDP